MSLHASILASAAVLAIELVPTAAHAQSGQPAIGDTAEDEPIVVTGTYIRRKDFESASPIQVIDQQQIQAQGFTQVTDLVRNLTINNGSRTSFDQSNNGRGGKTGFNLRGLGESSTLTLFNSRRVAPRGTQANTFPLLAIGRIEVLKDGSSALYGADAVAGVVNLVPRHVDGFQVDSQYSTTTNLGDESSDLSLSGAWGVDTGTTKLSLFATYFRRSESQAPPRFVRTSSNRTIQGFPGTFQPLAPVTTGPFAGTPALSIIPDPECGNLGNTFINSAGRCVSSVTNYLSFISHYDQFNAFAMAEHKVGRFKFKADILFSQLTDYPLEWLGTQNLQGTVPANHPDNYFGVATRYFGLAGDNSRGRRNWDTTTWRVAPSITYDLPNDWYIDVGLSYYQENINNVQRAVTTLPSRFQAALNGTGGPTGNQRFNPFSSALTNPARANSPELLYWLNPEQIQQLETQFEVWDAVSSGPILDLPGGQLAVAFGGQLRYERLYERLDPLTIERARAGNPTVPRFQDVKGFFAEVSAPVLSEIDLSFAVRHEDYGEGIGSATIPKIAARVAPVDWLTLRGSWGKSFRAPTPAQLDAQAIGRVNLPYVNPRSGPNCSGTAVGFANAANVGNPNLKPERSTNLNLGAQVARNGLRAGLDYWNFNFTDQVARTSGQEIILADCRATNGGFPQDPRITTNALGDILEVAVTLENLSTIKTDGIDFNIGYGFDAFGGNFSIDSTTTYVDRYNIQLVPGGPVVNGAGLRNKRTNSISMPRWRSNTTFAWTGGPHTVTLVGRYISQLQDDAANMMLGAFFTVDAQYSHEFRFLGADRPTRIDVGMINIGNRQAPDAVETWGFDSSVHDPRGRMVYIRANQRF